MKKKKEINEYDNSESENENDNSESESEESFEVEKIVNHRFRNGKTQYEVKWEGYSSDQNTWETEDKFDSKTIINEYLLRIKSEKNSKKK